MQNWQRALRSLLRSKWAPFGGAALGFMEGSFVVFPMEPLFLPAMVAASRRVWMLAAWLVAGNVLGAMVMYGLGAWAAETVIVPVFERLGAGDDFRAAGEALRERGAVALALASLTPFPFQAATAAAGAAGYAFAAFVCVVTAARGVRYFALAGLVRVAGARIDRFVEKHDATLMLAGVAVFLAVAAWIVVAG